MIETPGSLLKTARIKKDLSLDEISARLKISKEKIIAIENNNFLAFSSDVFVIGIIRRYAKIINAPSDYIIQLFNRDHKLDLKKVKVETRFPTEFMSNSNSLTDKLKLVFQNKKFVLGLSSLFIILLVIFIIRNLINTTFKPPYLKIDYPVELAAGDETEFSTESNTLVIKGNTEKNTIIKINNIPLNIKTGLNFESGPLPITSDENVFNIEAVNNLGVKSQLKLTVKRIFKKLEVPEGN